MLELGNIEIDSLDGESFEKLIADLLSANEFVEISMTPKTADFGADILAIKKGEKFAIQVKRSTSTIGLAAIQEVLGGMAYYGAKRGIVVTNSSFAVSARELAKRAGIELFDRKTIKHWLSHAKLAAPDVIKPRPHQIAAIEELARLRNRGENRALAIMASGLGKTYLAAFDSLRFQGTLGKPIRVLYLSHQGVILEQASQSFKRVYGAKRRFGRFDGEVRDRAAELLFATFQSMHENLSSFDPDAFEYLIIDEAHHTAAPTRDKVVNYFRPLFRLGLTATPNRGDGQDIYAYYNDVVGVSLPLERAIAENLLSPIDYRVFSDRVDPNALGKALALTSKKDLDVEFVPRSDQEISKIILAEAKKLDSDPRIIIFCSSLAQMSHFSKRFKGARSISGKNSHAEQVRLVDDFKAGAFGVLLARDVLNEGIDIPDANVIVFLRNTTSPVVFLQQLGRGLRKADDKKKVLVLDFVNNIDRFNFVYSFFSRLDAETRSAQKRKGLKNDFVSVLELDQTAKDVISSIIRKKEMSGFICEATALVKSLDHHVTASTIRHIIDRGNLIPDFTHVGSDGIKRYYLERASVMRFMRQVHSAKTLDNLIPEREMARRVGKNVSWLKQRERLGFLSPTWIHRRATGQIEFFFDETDEEHIKNISAQRISDSLVRKKN